MISSRALMMTSIMSRDLWPIHAMYLTPLEKYDEFCKYLIFYISPFSKIKHMELKKFVVNKSCTLLFQDKWVIAFCTHDLFNFNMWTQTYCFSLYPDRRWPAWLQSIKILKECYSDDNGSHTLAIPLRNR